MYKEKLIQSIPRVGCVVREISRDEVEEISQALRDHMLRFRMKGLCIPEIADRSNEGHRRILQAIKSGDPQEIESAVSFHLNSTKKNVTEILS